MEPLRGFDGEFLDPDDETLGAAGLTTSTVSEAASTSNSLEPESLAFANDDQGAVAPALEDGVCVVLDQMFDTHFAQSADEQSPFADIDNLALLRSLNDGPFGAEWNRFAEAAFTDGGSRLNQNQEEFGEEWILATNQLAEDQCGFSAMTALIATFTGDCFTPIAPDGERGEPLCARSSDPR